MKNYNIIISREGSIGRRFINHSEVIQLLSEYNFKEYKLEFMSENEKIHLFSNAKNIIGANGAGLINLIYCKNANVIAITGKNSQRFENRTLRSIFEDISSSLGLNYNELLSELSYSSYTNDNFGSSLHEYDIYVDLKQLTNLMKKTNMIK